MAHVHTIHIHIRTCMWYATNLTADLDAHHNVSQGENCIFTFRQTTFVREQAD